MAKKYSNINWDKYWQRIEHEDNLLNNRTNIYLVLNGLGAVAIGLQTNVRINIVISAMMLLINMFWIIGSSQNTSVLKKLTSIYIEHSKDSIDEIVRDSMKIWPRWIRNTSILGRYIPLVITFGWVLGIYFLLLS